MFILESLIPLPIQPLPHLVPYACHHLIPLFTSTLKPRILLSSHYNAWKKTLQTLINLISILSLCIQLIDISLEKSCHTQHWFTIDMSLVLVRHLQLPDNTIIFFLTNMLSFHVPFHTIPMPLKSTSHPSPFPLYYQPLILSSISYRKWVIIQ